MDSAIAGIERIVNSPEARESISALHKTLEDADALIQNVDAHVGLLATSIQETVRDARKLVRNMDGQVGPI
jgi:hypothetical protein